MQFLIQLRISNGICFDIFCIIFQSLAKCTLTKLHIVSLRVVLIESKNLSDYNLKL